MRFCVLSRFWYSDGCGVRDAVDENSNLLIVMLMFCQVENEIMNKLDKLVNYNKKTEGSQRRKEHPSSNKRKGDDEYKELFHEM